MGLALAGNRSQVGLPQGGVVLDGNLHIMRSPFGRDFFVMTAAQLSFLKGDLRSRAFTTVNAALNATEANRGDRVYLCEGYTESITGADQWSNLKAGTRIIGLGDPSSPGRPTITWTASGSTVLMDVAQTVFENLVLQMEPTTGTVNVAAPITVSAAGCQILGCRINCGTDANNKVTIGITCTAGASDFTFAANKVRGAAAATCTTFLRLNGQANPTIVNNDIVCGTTSAAVGPVQELTAACTFIKISNNLIQNNAASSTACITMDLANTTGWISDNYLRNMTDANVAHIVVTSGDVQMYLNKIVNNSNETEKTASAGTPSV